MSNATFDARSESDLRLRALARVSGRGTPEAARDSTLAALRVLHDLASSPATAADALALLHELQVHQVELDLQEENLRGSLADMEAALSRQTQLYECAPVGYCTVDAGTGIHELNPAGAELLGFERDALLGRSLENYLAPHSVIALHAALARLAKGGRRESCTLQLLSHNGAARNVRAGVAADPDGRRFLIAFLDNDTHESGPGH